MFTSTHKCNKRLCIKSRMMPASFTNDDILKSSLNPFISTGVKIVSKNYFFHFSKHGFWRDVLNCYSLFRKLAISVPIELRGWYASIVSVYLYPLGRGYQSHQCFDKRVNILILFNLLV